jgi:hypothetical protein
MRRNETSGRCSHRTRLGRLFLSNHRRSRVTRPAGPSHRLAYTHDTTAAAHTQSFESRQRDHSPPFSRPPRPLPAQGPHAMLATPQPRLTSPSLSSSTSSGSSSATPPTPKRQLSLNNKHQSTHAPFNPSLDSVPRTVEHSPVSYDFPAGAGDELSEARELRMPQPRTRRSQQQAAFGSSAGMRTAGGSTGSAGRSDAGNQLEAKVVIRESSIRSTHFIRDGG